MVLLFSRLKGMAASQTFNRFVLEQWKITVLDLKEISRFIIHLHKVPLE